MEVTIQGTLVERTQSWVERVEVKVILQGT